MSVQSFQIFSASCVECAAVTAMCQASVMSWSFSFRTSWSSSRPAPRSNQRQSTVQSVQQVAPCTNSSPRNHVVGGANVPMHDANGPVHMRIHEPSQHITEPQSCPGTCADLLFGKDLWIHIPITNYPCWQSNKQQYAGRCWLVESELQINSLDDVTSHRLWSRKLLELRQCICHRAWRYFHWKQCRITFSTVKCISSSTTDVKWWAMRIHA